jgi:hypothetical protein
MGQAQSVPEPTP